MLTFINMRVDKKRHLSTGYSQLINMQNTVKTTFSDTYPHY